jgi:hypothetical protein
MGAAFIENSSGLSILVSEQERCRNAVGYKAKRTEDTDPQGGIRVEAKKSRSVGVQREDVLGFPGSVPGPTDARTRFGRVFSFPKQLPPWKSTSTRW